LSSARTSYCQVAPGYISVSSPISARPGPGGRRGRIKMFSRASARRLARYILSLDEPPALFATLTYPARYSTPQEAKVHMHTFSKRFRRKFPSCWFVWHLEPQRRGAPHFHLAMGGPLPRLAWFRRWISLAWYQVVGSGDERHYRAGTNVEKVTSHRGLVAYLCKYLAKPVETLPEGWQTPGRWWGIVGRGNLPPRPCVIAKLDFCQAAQLRRLLRRWLRSISRNRKVGSLCQHLKRFFAATLYLPSSVTLRLLNHLGVLHYATVYD
jgi:hypothetical protein